MLRGERMDTLRRSGTNDQKIHLDYSIQYLTSSFLLPLLLLHNCFYIDTPSL